MGAKVYFSKTITGEKVLELYKLLGISLPGNVAVKVHSGEEGNQNFLRPDFWKPMVDAVAGTVVECNTAYEGTRNTTKKHMATLSKHGWSTSFPVDLLDAQGPDMVLEIPEGKQAVYSCELEFDGTNTITVSLDGSNVFAISSGSKYGAGTYKVELAVNPAQKMATIDRKSVV